MKIQALIALLVIPIQVGAYPLIQQKTPTVFVKDSKFVVASEGKEYSIELYNKIDWVTKKEIKIPVPTAKGDSIKVPSAIDTFGIRYSLVRTALSCRGARYVRGGASKRGMDCSGLVKYVYAKHGIQLPHDSRTLYTKGVPVSKSNLKPGDTLFFVNTYRHGISHVGIYIGNGMFIHAANHRRGVIVSYLYEEYYIKHYLGAKRIY